MLGAQLRSMRVNQAKLSLERASELSHLSLPTLSRMENGKRHITSEDVAVLLTLYGIRPKERAALIQAARGEVQAGWWQPPPPPELPGLCALSGLLPAASSLTELSLGAIPKLLQTYDYAASCMHLSGAASAQVAAWWRVQERHQQELQRVDYTAFIHETALLTPVANPHTLFDQLVKLIEASKRGIGVRLVRAGRQVGLLTHSWLLMEFPKEQPVIHVNLGTSGVFLHDPQTSAYLDLRTRITQSALTSEHTRRSLQSMVDRLAKTSYL
ncbi:Scr1 family TA system antitoxin-like transcriptional regulator [Actinokineospora fastidiosa]|uniref:Transcriptional regulator n=1 Tax=Actinokineospora fastidiosa TaxID=1816 RepID=A0A918GC29_9PSEU|nr:Scr1 family TA system antitoxin-like transcriptional regulator [Actinokineospora fastidiosa]GGS28283.1 transcriptional regulator [Actinokineospora fastidiosa]